MVVVAVVPGGKLGSTAIKGTERALGKATETAVQTTVKKGWGVGGDIYAATRKGNDPAWSTVRARYWKNEAANPQLGNWDAEALDRMSRGRAPQRYNFDKGGMESYELSHEPVPMRDGGKSVVPRRPQDHASSDPYRYPGY